MRKSSSVLSHMTLLVFISGMLLPLYLALVAASSSGEALMQARLSFIPGPFFIKNLTAVLTTGLAVTGGEPLWVMLLNSLILALLIACGKLILALAAAFSLVYFAFPFKKTCFALIFATMMLPVEVRIIPTFQLIASIGLLNSFAGLSLPLLASATGTMLFRQFFKTIPHELVEAARLDGAGPLHFFFDILLPLSRTPLCALFVILFVYGWNQYLWPLVITTEPKMATVVMGIRYLAGVADQIPQWHYIMMIALIALSIPCLIVLVMQKWFEEGLK